MDLGLQGKVAIITGGSDGIGKATALSMAKEGANVVIVARRHDVLEQAAEEIKTATEGAVVALSADVTQPDTARQAVQTAVDHFGRLDVLVNNAGVSMAKSFEEVSQADWEFDFELKVWGAVRLIQESLPEMRKVGGGRIINVTNLAGRTPGPVFHAHLHLPGHWHRHHQGAFQRLGPRQHPGDHRLYRPDQERPAPEQLPCSGPNEAWSDPGCLL